MIRVETIAELRQRCNDARQRGATVGFVPTMGFFHEGHLSLMRAARRSDDLVVTSIFVNRLQFAPGEDLASYPRDIEADAAAAEAVGVDVLFVPSDDEMYSTMPVTTVHVSGLTDGLCGASRPTFFDGVVTVLTKLFSIVGRCRAYFGRKDFQQLVVVRRLVTDLDLPVEVVACPLVREPNGVALSSRNLYLDSEQHVAATVLFRALSVASDAIASGERDAAAVRDLLRGVLASERAAVIDYVAVVDSATLQPVEQLDGEVLLAVAAQIGVACLIDNMTLTIDDGDVLVDAGLRSEPIRHEEQPCSAS